jgi:hypothetical protein
MTSKLNQFWLGVGAIWLAVFVMTAWNFNKIDAIAQARENGERQRKEVVFQQRNSEKLLHVSKLQKLQFKPVASTKLGFESIRSALHALAAMLGLENVQIESRMAQATTEQVPFVVRMQGGTHGALGFVTALSRYPYLAVQNSRIVVHNAAGDTEIELELVFNFRIETQEETAPNALQASAASPGQGGRNR